MSAATSAFRCSTGSSFGAGAGTGIGGGGGGGGGGKVEDRLGILEAKVEEMESLLGKYNSRFRDQKLFCKYVAEYLLHKFGFNIWLRLEMVKAAGEGEGDMDTETLVPADLPSIFRLAVNKSTREKILMANIAKANAATPTPPVPATTVKAAAKPTIPPAVAVPPAPVPKPLPLFAPSMEITVINGKNGQSDAGNRNHSVGTAGVQTGGGIPGPSNKRRLSPNSCCRDQIPPTKTFARAVDSGVVGGGSPTIVANNSVAAQNMVSGTRFAMNSTKSVPSSMIPGQTHVQSMAREIRVMGNVVEIPEIDISGLSKENEDTDPLDDLDFGIPQVQDCSAFSGSSSRSTNSVEIVHEDYNDPSIDIKYEDNYNDEGDFDLDNTTEEAVPSSTGYKGISPQSLIKATSRCRRSSPFDMNWLFHMRKYQANVMPYGILIKRDELRQWFEYLPNEKPENSRYRCRLCYKYIQTYGIPRPYWGPVESERGQLKSTETDNRNAINAHGKKKSHLEVMKRLEMDKNPEAGYIEQFDKAMKRELLETLDNFS